MRYFLTVSSLPANPNLLPLLSQLQAAGLPVIDVQTSGAYTGQVIVVSSIDLITAQLTQMQAVVSAFDLRSRIPRPLYAIYNDLVALTTTQQANIWADISSGTTPKYLLDAGPNTAALVVLDWAVRSSGATGTALTAAKFRAVALYVQDNPTYLVTPTFDATINVPGDMPEG